MSDFENFVREMADQNSGSVSLGKWRDLIAEAQRVVDNNPMMEEDD